jgi:hypothetical protein
MATSTAGSRWPREGRPHRAAMLLGHYQEHIQVAVLPLLIGNVLAGRPPVLTWISYTVLLAWFVSFLADQRQHQRQLCERCISAAPTLNPQGAVERWRRVLWCFHQKRAYQLMMLAAICWIFYSSRIRHEHEWALSLDALILVLIGFSYFTGIIHKRLYPWCPYCHWGDGGGEEVTPPVPEDHGVLT